MSEADPKQRRGPMKVVNVRHEVTGICWRGGTRGKDQQFRVRGSDHVDGHVVAIDAHLALETLEIIDEIERERIKIVNHRNAHGAGSFLSRRSCGLLNAI